MTIPVPAIFNPKALLALAVVAGSFFSLATQAQPVYRIVGPDGKVTFSDRAPAAAGPATDKPANAAAPSGAASGGAATGNLPYELKQVTGKFPVTLYTGDSCVPCDSGRNMLVSRGIPFTEKTVNTVEDSKSLERISGDTSLPFLSIGGQQLKGYSDAEWAQYLNAAGYPAKSALPSSYRRPPATPLVAIIAAPAPKAESSPAPAPTPAPAPRIAPQPSVTNPAGIQF